MCVCVLFLPYRTHHAPSQATDHNLISEIDGKLRVAIVADRSVACCQYSVLHTYSRRLKRNVTSSYTLPTSCALLRVFGMAHINLLKSKTYFIYRQFNIQKFYVLPTQSIYVFCVDVRTNSDHFPIQH